MESFWKAYTEPNTCRALLLEPVYTYGQKPVHFGRQKGGLHLLFKNLFGW